MRREGKERDRGSRVGQSPEPKSWRRQGRLSPNFFKILAQKIPPELKFYSIGLLCDTFLLHRPTHSTAHTKIQTNKSIYKNMSPTISKRNSKRNQGSKYKIDYDDECNANILSTSMYVRGKQKILN